MKDKHIKIMHYCIVIIGLLISIFVLTHIIRSVLEKSYYSFEMFNLFKLLYGYIKVKLFIGFLFSLFLIMYFGKKYFMDTNKKYIIPSLIFSIIIFLFMLSYIVNLLERGYILYFLYILSMYSGIINWIYLIMFKNRINNFLKIFYSILSPVCTHVIIIIHIMYGQHGYH
jgi:hypothetical protein